MTAAVLSILSAAVLYASCHRSVRRAWDLRRQEEVADNRLAGDVLTSQGHEGRLLRDMAAAWASSLSDFTPEPPHAGGAPLENDAEEREAALSRQLLAGQIEAATYRWRMGALAHAPDSVRGQPPSPT